MRHIVQRLSPTYQGGTLFQMVLDLWRRLTPRRRRQFGMLLGLMLFASLAEVCSVAAVLPFLGVLTAPERVLAYPAAQPILHFLSITNPQQLLLPVVIGFCGAALVSTSSNRRHCRQRFAGDHVGSRWCQRDVPVHAQPGGKPFGRYGAGLQHLKLNDQAGDQVRRTIGD